jgi:hypothetical protein
VAWEQAGRNRGIGDGRREGGGGLDDDEWTQMHTETRMEDTTILFRHTTPGNKKRLLNVKRETVKIKVEYHIMDTGMWAGK